VTNPIITVGRRRTVSGPRGDVVFIVSYIWRENALPRNNGGANPLNLNNFLTINVSA
jgi:hypothetical protein